MAGGSVHDPAMEREIARRDDTKKDPPSDVIKAYAPYLIIIAVFSIAQIAAIKDGWPSRPGRRPSSGPGSTCAARTARPCRA